jgi:hypothetical protein
MSVIFQDSQPDRLISLREACVKFFGGAISVASLKAEAGRGNLTISKIGRAYFTTPKDINAMVEKCRVTVQARSSVSIRTEVLGPSSTENVSNALASARQTVEMLKRRSKSTEAKSTGSS